MIKAGTDRIIVYCDGACSGNQFAENAGGWGALLQYFHDGKLVKTNELLGGEANTTNNRMELTACLKALAAIKKKSISVEVYTDSAYLSNCINQRWFENWEQNGWLNKNKKPVENRDLWTRLLKQMRGFAVIRFFKVRGHADDPLNKRADWLANQGLKEIAGRV